MKENAYVKFAIKNHHDKPGDVVSRELYRAFTKLDKDGLIEDDKALIYGYVHNSEVYELITGKKLDCSLGLYEIVSNEDILEFLKGLSKSDVGRLCYLIKMIVFGEKTNVNFMEVSTMEDRSKDRRQLFEEYMNNSSVVNPYDQNHTVDYDDLPTRIR